MAGMPTRADLEFATAEAIALVETLHANSDSDSGRVAWVLAMALQVIHLMSPPHGRSLIEENMRRLLASMYKAPPAPPPDADGFVSGLVAVPISENR